MSILSSNEISKQWDKDKEILAGFFIPDGTGGINPGDRRALYYLIKGFTPEAILEVGTHIGASTVHLACALRDDVCRSVNNAKLTTVDIVDVNSTQLRHWQKFGADRSPGEMISSIRCQQLVQFVTSRSVDFFNDFQKKFDFIFLDGDHSASTVYREIPMALKLLNENGLILLHDFFPDNKPLWSDGYALPGPYLAVKRLQEEGANFHVLPLGTLPWQTKPPSSVTSLALLTQR